MKTAFATFGRRLAGLGTAALLAFSASELNSFAQPASPVGMWDCTMSGNGQEGILFLNFTTDTDTNTGLPTFEGIFVQAGHRKLPADGRDGATSTGRSTGAGAGITNLFGGGFINGSAGPVADNGGPNDWLSDSRSYRGTWFFNNKGETVGQYYTVLNATGSITNFFETCVDQVISIPETNGGSFNLGVSFCFTNAVIVTNYPWSAPDGEVGTTNLAFTNLNFTVGFAGLTNEISFVGKVVPGKRLTMVGTSLFGKFAIRGTPLQQVSTALPLDGFYWSGSKFENGYRAGEQFILVPSGIPNVYGMNGAGPSYTYNSTNFFNSSICLISSHKRIGFSVDELGINENPDSGAEVRATIGKLINTTKKIGTKSIGDSSGSLDLIEFDASLVPFAVPTP